MSNYITIKLRRGTAAQWTATNPVLAEGEVGLETDTRKFKVGTGAAAWNSMQYWGGSGGGAADFIDLGDVPASYAGQGGKYVKVKSTADGLEFGTLTVAISDVTGLSAALSNLVPYAGASGDVNLGEWGMQVGNLEFDNTPTNTPGTDGSVFWDSGDGTLQLQMKGGATQKVGMNTFARVYNDSGVQLVKGEVVYISGAQGNRIAAKKAQANTESTAKNTFAIVVETIAIGAEGTVITEGPLYQLNTLGLTAGATLYLSPTTAGGYTETQPQAPNHLVIIGFVERVHATVGSIYVKISNGFELEELHDVDLTESKTTPIDADALLLQDSADSSIWKRLTWANLKATLLTYFNGEYVAKNTAITGATKTKITYDAKGLVTAGADATTADIGDSTDKRYVTEAEKTKLSNLSGTNTGDQNLFSTIAVSGQSNVVADTTGDTLTLVAGSNITITTDATTDSITISSSGGGGGSTAWGTITGTLSNQTDLQTALDGKVDENAAITGATKTKITYDAKGLVTAGADAAIADITGLQTALDGKVDENAAITPGTKTKITYDAKGLVTAGADATTADIADSNDKRYVTEAEKTKLSNTSGTNSGDQTITLTGDVTGTGTGSFAATIANNAVSLAKIQDITTARILGRVTAGSGDPEQLTGTEVTTLLDTFTSSLKGLAPASGGGTTNFLRADGTWAAPSGGGGGGNTQIYIDQSPDNGTYGAITGSINGSNTVFTVSQAVYITGSLVVMLDGVLLTQGASQDWTETTPASGTFTLNFAPATGSVLTVWYNKTVVVGANFTAGTAVPTGGSDGDIYLQYT